MLSTRFPEELTTHLKLYKQSRVRLKHIQLLSAKEVNGTSKLSPKKQDDKKTHRRNKSETDLNWLPGKFDINFVIHFLRFSKIKCIVEPCHLLANISNSGKK